MKKAAWGEKHHDLPSLQEICCYTTSREVAGYLIGNNFKNDAAQQLKGNHKAKKNDVQKSMGKPRSGVYRSDLE